MRRFALLPALVLASLSACSLSTEEYSFDGSATAGASGSGAGESGKGGSSGASGSTSGTAGSGAAGTTGGTSGAAGNGLGGSGGDAGGGGVSGTGGAGPCAEGSKQCKGMNVEVCKAGAFEKAETCTSEMPCVNGICSVCKPDEGKCSGANLLRCAKDGSGFDLVKTCENAALICDPVGDNGKGECDKCVKDAFQCVGQSLFKCNATGQGLTLVKDCGAAALCDAAGGKCGSATCTPGQRACEGAQPVICDSVQNKFIPDGVACGSNALCNPASATCFACETGKYECMGDQLRHCNTEGSGFVNDALCPAGKCDASMKTCTACTNGTQTCQGQVLKQCAGGTFEPGVVVKTCATGEICDSVNSQCDTCVPGGLRCTGALLEECDAAGEAYTTKLDCGKPELCDEGASVCKVCVPNEVRCSSAVLERCTATGSAWETLATCATPELCNQTGQVCDTPACAPGKTKCDPGGQWMVCNGGQTGFDVKDTCKVNTACIPDEGCATAVLKSPEALASGDAHSCAIFGTTGALFCWGDNTKGQCGRDPALGANQFPQLIPTGSSFLDNLSQVVAGSRHTCALYAGTGGTVVCWGDNNRGQVGDGTTNVAISPKKVFSGAVRIAAGGESTCATKADGSTYCWGNNANGQLCLGNGGLPTQLTDVKTLMDSTTALTVGATVVCGVDSAGKTRCCGSDVSGKLGNGPGAASNTPSIVLTTGGSTYASARVFHNGAVSDAIGTGCGISAAGAVSCWGEGSSGAIGNSANADATNATAVSGLASGAGVLAIADNRVCASSGSSVVCWGSCGVFASCAGLPFGNFNVPTKAISNIDIDAISLGSAFGCVIKNDGRVACFGNAFSKKLGSAGADSTSPRDISFP